MFDKLFNFHLPKSKSVDKAIENVTAKPAKTMGKVLDSLIYLGGHGIIQRAKKQKLLDRLDYESFKETVTQGVSDIPKDKLRSPDFRVVASALDGAIYADPHSNIRDMFAKLIISSAHKDFSVYSHIAFVEIIKQLSPVDARIFQLLVYKAPVPLCKVFLLDDPGFINLVKTYKNAGLSIDDENSNFVEFPNLKGTDISTHHIIIDEIAESQYVISQSMDNLSRLGLIEISYEHALPGSSYSSFENDPVIADYLSQNDEKTSYVLIPGSCHLTVFGKTFSKVCLD